MLEIITAPALAPRHGFFTRKGGASSGIFAGLNCGFGSSDQSEMVAINRARVAEAMGVDASHLITVHQTHSTIALPVSGPVTGTLPIRPEADAMVTATAGIALAILTADCQPVLFADTQAGVIGAAHAGWKGAQGGVLEATLEAMAAMGAQRGRITAVIGPCISQASYEVGQEFFENFTDDDPSTRRFFAQGRAGKMLFDLPAYGLARLRAAGVGHAEWCGHCTYRAPDRFYSFRRSTHLAEADYGRLISVIRL